MASYETHRSYSSSKSAASPPLPPLNTSRQSSISSPSVYTPRVQLVPHSRQPSYDASLSPSDLDSLSKTAFDSKDMSSKDFDFEDVFTYDKPQRKLKSVVEVSVSPGREWNSYLGSHLPASTALRQKVNERIGVRGERARELLMKNSSAVRKKQ